MRRGRYGIVRYIALLSVALATPLVAQTADPASAIARDQARQAAERAAAERAARANAPRVDLGRGTAVLGAFPVEDPCFTIRQTVIEPPPPRQLRWLRGELAKYRGRCAGKAGLNYILADLQSQLIEAGLVTTRVGLPEQDLASGTLRVAVVPGVVSSLRGGTPKQRRAWRAASPIGDGDLVNLRAIEQGLEQMRRVPGREVSVDLSPGGSPGESVFNLTTNSAQPIRATLSANNFAGLTVGRWQGSGQASALDVLGFNEILSVSLNGRLSNPSVPADSRSTGASFGIPLGWYTFTASASESRYRQTVIGEVQDFQTRGTLKAITASIDRVINRDRTSKTSLQLQVQRRYGRSFINDIEIGLQHQDLADIEVSLLDRRSFGRAQFVTAVSYRVGTGLFGAQDDQPGQPAELPSARYRIGTVDAALFVPLGERLTYNAAFRGQVSDRNVFGPDLFAVGGPYTVRGFDSDRALLGRTGWYLRQELSVTVARGLRPYALADVGRVRDQRLTPVGVGAGIRASVDGPFGTAFVDAFVAIPVTAAALVGPRLAQVGVSVGMSF